MTDTDQPLVDDATTITPLEVNLGYYSDRPTEALPYDAVDALGLDGTGRDGNNRFPYTWATLTEAERMRLLELAGDEDEDEVVVSSTVSKPDLLRATRLKVVAVLLAAAWVLSAVTVIGVLLVLPEPLVLEYTGWVIACGLLAALAATCTVIEEML